MGLAIRLQVWLNPFPQDGIPICLRRAILAPTREINRGLACETIGGGNPEFVMPDAQTESSLAAHLLQIAHDPEIRQEVYDQLGEYCHRCRNRLNSLKLSLYVTMRQSAASMLDTWTELDHSYQYLERRVERIQALCRPMNLSRLTMGLHLLIDDRRERWSRLLADRGCLLEFDPPTQPVVAVFDVEWMGRALDALAAWRAEEAYESQIVRLRWWSDSNVVQIAWEERPPPFFRVPNRPLSDAPTWNLPLIIRVLLAHGGQVQCRDDDGWNLVLSWPS